MEAKYSVRCVRDIAYCAVPDPKQFYDFYLPETDEPVPVFVYFHGGGLTGGSKNGQAIAAELAGQGIAVVSADYRLMPAVSYPAFLEDAADAVAHVMAHAAEYCRPTRFYVGGHSAGCYLSMMLAFDRRYLAVRGIDAGQLGGYALISGGTTKHFALLAAAGEDKRLLRIDDTCVLWHLRPDGPPLFVVSSPEDMPTRREQNLLFVSALRRLEYTSPIEYHEYPGVKHSFFTRRNAETGEIPIAADLLAFLRRCEAAER